MANGIELSDGKGVAAPQWATNEELMSADVNIVSEALYKNLSNVATLLTRASQVGTDYVLSGFQITVTGSLAATVGAGLGSSTQGAYFTSSGAWGFVANSGSSGYSFVVLNPADAAISFSANTDASNSRIDIIEVAPTRLSDSNASRNFIDPVTSAVTATSTPTRYNFSASVVIKQGTAAASPVAPTVDAGYIKLAEVTVPPSSGAITQSDVVDFGSSSSWTTAASSTLLFNSMTWDPLRYYEEGEPVIYNSELYIAAAPSVGSAPVAYGSTPWAPFAGPQIVRAEYQVEGGATLASGDTIILPTLVEDTNSAYSTTTGDFTAPVAGVYTIRGELEMSVNTAGTGYGEVYFTLWKNGTQYPGATNIGKNSVYAITASSGFGGSFSTSVRVAKNDTVAVHIGFSLGGATLSASSTSASIIFEFGGT